MAELEEHVLNIEDFVRARKPDGTIVLTHPTFSGTVELGPNESPMWLFPRLKEFSEKNGVLLNPKLARLANGVEDDLNGDTWGEDEFEDDLY